MVIVIMRLCARVGAVDLGRLDITRRVACDRWVQGPGRGRGERPRPGLALARTPRPTFPGASVISERFQRPTVHRTSRSILEFFDLGRSTWTTSLCCSNKPWIVRLPEVRIRSSTIRTISVSTAHDPHPQEIARDCGSVISNDCGSMQSRGHSDHALVCALEPWTLGQT